MSASHWQGVSRAPLRVALAIFAAAIFLVETWNLSDQLADPFFHAESAFLLDLLRPSPWLLVGLYAVGNLGLAAVGTGRAPLRGGLLALLLMAPVCQWGTEIFGDPSHNFFFPGAVLFGWLVGLAWARWLESRGVAAAAAPAFREALAESAAVGVLAALYVGSGVSKLVIGGFMWAGPDNIRSVVLAQQGLAHAFWVEAYRTAVIESPRLSQALAVATLVVELGAVALLVNRTLRAVWGVLLLGLHLNIYVLLDIPYIEPMFLVPLFTFPWPELVRRLRGRPAPKAPIEELPASATPLPTPIVASTAALVLLGLVLRAFG